MRKKILGSIGVLAITAIIAFSINLDTKSNEISLTLMNVEALASEGSDKTELWCCGNSNVCAYSEESPYIIRGTLSTKRCQ